MKVITFAMAVAIVAISSALVPLALGPYGIRVATTLCMFIALAQSWNLIGGYAGLMSLAHPAFFGTGAIATAILLVNGAPLWLAALGALALALALAATVGVPTLRLQGHYFVAATILATEAARNFVLNLDAFHFNGGVTVNIVGQVGLKDLTAAQYNQVFFCVMAGLAAASTLLVLAFEHSRWGLALRAMRDGERAAGALGVPVTTLKIGVFLLSAAIAAAVGIGWACWLGTVETNEAYSLAFTFEVIVMVLLGGRGTAWGPVIGVAFILLLNEWIGVEFSEIGLIISGAIVAIVVLFQPDGLVRILREGLPAISLARLGQNLHRYRVR